MPVLDEALADLRLQTVVTSRAILTAPWGIQLPGERFAGKFLLVQEGHVIIEVDGLPPVRLHPGDFAVALGDKPHVIRDAPHTPAVSIYEVLRRENLLCERSLAYHYGGGGAETRTLSGKFMFEDLETHPLLRALPELLVVRASDGPETEWLEMTLAFIACEASSNRPGSKAVINSLLSVLFVQAVRSHVGRDHELRGWLRAVKDPDVGRAMALMHAELATDWTLERLAEEATMSRSAFAQRFKSLAGETPGQYLVRWRMHRAASLLRAGRTAVAEVARAVGYESEAAFARAFKRTVGQTPGAYRAAA